MVVSSLTSSGGVFSSAGGRIVDKRRSAIDVDCRVSREQGTCMKETGQHMSTVPITGEDIDSNQDQIWYQTWRKLGCLVPIVGPDYYDPP